jgi:clan AA aspartic protease (TIGR02281 family)
MWCRDKIVWALPACLAVCGCQGGGASAGCQLVHVTDLDLVQQGYGFYTGIAINGRNVVLLFDTGGTENLLAESAARRIGMSVRTSGDAGVSGVGGSSETGEVHADNVRIGAAHGEDLTFATVPDRVYHGDADGILGMNFLYSFDMDLDFWGGRIGLYKAFGGCDTPHVVMTQPLYGVALAQSQHDYGVVDLGPAVYVSVNGKKLRATIDTGAAHTTIFRDSARRAGLDTADLLARTTMHGVGPRAVQAELRLSAPVAIGDLTVNNMPVFIANQRHPEDVDMLLGYDFVTRVHVWISRSSGTVVMQFPPRATPVLGEK